MEIDLSSTTTLDLTSFQLHDLDSVELPSNLTELDLTANRLSKLDPRIENLINLRKLSFRQNLIDDAAIDPISRWESLSGLEVSSTLKELYVSKNEVTKMEEINHLHELQILELGSNRLRDWRLEDLWLNDNQIESLENIAEAVSGSREKLTTIYLENNPCAKSPNYQATLRQMFHNIEQIDSNIFA
ncbi:hypothetical protein V6N13_136264 [Hibiscus sabdariffa]|uniref:Uncharacterized protein n=1 Tax=Hibiscus sabdariffa TaxID=183260 RepID=A0ABR2DP42_9ROSI